MASKESARALRPLATSVRRPQIRWQRRSLCVECLAAARERPAMRGTRRPTTYRERAFQPAKAARCGMATMSEFRRQEYGAGGPIAEYDSRVQSGRLRDDAHQRTIVQALQDLHDVLLNYRPAKVVHPTIESLQPKKKSLLGSLFGAGGGGGLKLHIPEDLPKGMYMYGDVGSGKTMLMDLFYDTLPETVHNKTRIHFHNFMQEVHKELHKMKIQHGNDIDAIPFVAASIAEKASVLCFDEFQCTDVADAMILRRLIEAIMSHGTVLVTTSNRHPSDLYKNGIQRDSFIPCINLLLDRMKVINLDSTTDYRKIPRPPSGVYHHPLDSAARKHAVRWFEFFGDFGDDPPHKAKHMVWGREIDVPRASGRACLFTFNELMGRATGAADYLELMRSYEAFIVTDVPGMNYRSRDLARRFITFVDAVYESRAKLVLTTATPLSQLFMSKDEVDEALDSARESADAKTASTAGAIQKQQSASYEGSDVNDAMRSLMDDLGMNMTMLKNSSFFTGDEEAFAFARALSRLAEMGSQEWVERGLSPEKGGEHKDAEAARKARSRWREDSY